MAAKKKTMKKVQKKEYVIVRCTQAGVHAGYLEKVTATHIVLSNARRIWYWSGAASLSELAVYGLNPARASQSKICVKVRTQQLKFEDHCEIVACEDAGRKSIESQPEWRA